MKADYDWSPMLNFGEKVLWEGQPSRFKFLLISASICAVALLAGWMAVTELAGAPGGSNCVTQHCPEADRKAGFIVVFVAPLTLVTLAVATPLFITSRLNCAVTNMRILFLHRAYWRRQPKFQQASVRGVDGMMLQAGSRRKLRTALTSIEELSGKTKSAKPGTS